MDGKDEFSNSILNTTSSHVTPPVTPSTNKNISELLHAV